MADLPALPSDQTGVGATGWRDPNLLAVLAALAVVLTLTITAMVLMRSDATSVVSVATASFGVVGSLVGAFFGIKIGTKNAKDAMDHVEKMMDK